MPDNIAVKVVWISGAYSLLSSHLPINRSAVLPNYKQLVARSLELSAEGYQDPEIARRLAEEGFRSARRTDVSRMLIEEVRRQYGQISLTKRFQQEEKIEGCWTVGGLARELAVSTTWLRHRIAGSSIPASRHPKTGRYLIPDDPTILAQLRAQAAVRGPS